MKDEINKCLILLSLDVTVLERYKDKVQQLLFGVDPNEILDQLFIDNRYKQTGTRVSRKSVPMILKNLKQYFKGVDEERVKELYAYWKIDFHQPTSNDYKELTDYLNINGVNHVYIKGIPFNKKAYPNTYVNRVSCDIDFLLEESSIDKVYEDLINTYGCQMMRREAGAHEFNKKYCQHYVPLTKNRVIYEPHHRLCSPIMEFCKVNEYVKELFARATVDESMGFPVKILSPEDQVFFLFCHMYYHQMYENAYHPKFYADIVGYIFNIDVDWEKVINYSNKYDTNRILFYCLLFLNEIHQYLFEEDLFDQSILIRIPKGMRNHLYECRSRTTFSDDIVGYHDSEPHELLFNYRHQTAAYEHLNSFHHPKRKEDKRRFIEKMQQCGIQDYDYDTYGDITS